MNTSRKKSVLQNGDRPASKHDANLRKNGTLYFQIGLIVVLLLSIFVIEYKSFYVIPKEEPLDVSEVYTSEPTPAIVVIKRELPPPPAAPVVDYTQPPVIGDPVDSLQIDLPVIDPTPPDDGDNDEGLKVSFVPEPEPEIETTDLMGVDFVPIYPGCENKKSNDERKDCLESSLNKLISRKFDTSISSEYGLDGVNRIYTIFTVDHTGKVIDVKIRAAHPALEKEAKRVIDLIPEMEPGVKDGKRVNMIYSQPILYKVEN